MSLISRYSIYTCLALCIFGLLPSGAFAARKTQHIVTISITTDSSGDATSTTSNVQGRIAYVFYKDGFDDTADFTITCDVTSVGVWAESNVTAAKVVQPTVAVQDQLGADRAQFDYIWCVGSGVKIVIAQGGNVKTAVFDVVFLP